MWPLREAKWSGVSLPIFLATAFALAPAARMTFTTDVWPLREAKVEWRFCMPVHGIFVGSSGDKNHYKLCVAIERSIVERFASIIYGFGVWVGPICEEDIGNCHVSFESSYMKTGVAIFFLGIWFGSHCK